MKNQQVKCICGISYWPAQGWQHKNCEPASNKADVNYQNASNIVDDASNNISVASNIDSDGIDQSTMNICATT